MIQLGSWTTLCRSCILPKFDNCEYSRGSRHAYTKLLSSSLQRIKQTSSRRAMPKLVQDDQRLSLLQPRRNRSPSPGAAASERQQLALHSFSKAATDPGHGTCLSDELVLLQVSLHLWMYHNCSTLVHSLYHLLEAGIRIHIDDSLWHVVPLHMWQPSSSM
jgi:hypothetical protein